MIEIKITGKSETDLFKGVCTLYYAFSKDNSALMNQYLIDLNNSDPSNDLKISSNVPINSNQVAIKDIITNTAANTVPVPTAQTVPIAAPTYTLEQLSVAGVEVADKHGRQALSNLLQTQFGVQAITQLQEGQYDAFAIALRQMGGTI